LSKENLYLGKTGEEIAVRLLKNNGYRIITRNYRTKLGEIDIIAEDKDTLCFIEVKTRNSDRFGLPCEAVFSAKQKQIAKAALGYLKEHKLLERKARFDVVSILNCAEGPKIDLIKDAFELDERYV
jgi:putative endonuclease